MCYLMWERLMIVSTTGLKQHWICIPNPPSVCLNPLPFVCIELSVLVDLIHILIVKIIRDDDDLIVDDLSPIK